MTTDPRPRITPASTALRWLYGLAIVALLVPSPMSGWVAMTTGGGRMSAFGLISLAVLAIGVWRIVQVAQFPSTLESVIVPGPVRWLRVAGIVMMAIAILLSLAHFGLGTVTRTLFGPRRSDNGIEFYVVGVWLAMIGGLGPYGIVMFELSRLMGFERLGRART